MGLKHVQTLTGEVRFGTQTKPMPSSRHGTFFSTMPGQFVTPLLEPGTIAQRRRLQARVLQKTKAEHRYFQGAKFHFQRQACGLKARRVYNTKSKQKPTIPNLVSFPDYWTTAFILEAVSLTSDNGNCLPTQLKATKLGNWLERQQNIGRKIKGSFLGYPLRSPEKFRSLCILVLREQVV